MFSFHATELFHSIESGMLTFGNGSYKRIFNYLKNFGIDGETEVVMPGTNAKMNEMQAAMGTLMLRHLADVIASRARITAVYRERLQEVPGIRLPQPLPADGTYNYAYMPIEVDEAEFGVSRDVLYKELERYNLITRRYFYPLLCDFACYRSLSVQDVLRVARRVAERILTLPIYPELELDAVHRICDMVIEIRKQKSGLLSSLTV